jgi:hypothetical protein
MENRTNGKPQLLFFAANEHRRAQISICFLRTENKKLKFVFLGEQTINGDQHLLSMIALFVH